MISRRSFHSSMAAVLLATITACGFVGCESRKELPATGQGGDNGPKKLTIGMIAKSQSNPVFEAARKGAEARAAALSDELKIPVTIDWRTPADEDAQKQAAFVEQLTGAGVDAIAIACSDAAKVTRAIDDAVTKGVIVMCFDSDAPDSKRLCYVGTDDFAAGGQVMANLAELFAGKEGTIAILAGNQTATNLQKRVNGAKEELAKHSNLTLKDVYYHKETPQDAYAEVESVQKANPEINGWAFIGGWPLMLDRQLPWEPGRVLCASMDTLPPILDHLRTGDVQVLLGQQYNYFGEQCVNLLVDKVRSGKDPEKVIDFAPLNKVTKENVDESATNAK